MINSYRDLQVWQRAIALTKLVYAASEHLPASERYGMTQQLRRAVISVALNIAEGKQRSTRKDFARFIEISIGSLNEVEAVLLICIELQMLDGYHLQKHFHEIATLRRMLWGLRKKLRSDPAATPNPPEEPIEYQMPET